MEAALLKTGRNIFSDMCVNNFHSNIICKSAYDLVFELYVLYFTVLYYFIVHVHACPVNTESIMTYIHILYRCVLFL